MDMCAYIQYMQQNKWSIPEKSIKNAAQKRWIQVHRTSHSKVTATNFFLQTKSLLFYLVKLKI